MSATKQSRKCIFCPNKADSKEHIWSQWILDILPPGEQGVFSRQFPDGSTKEWPTPKPVLTAGIVCRDSCNNGWMSAKLEEPMKAATHDIIIHNTKKSFSPAECRAIAAWTFKTMVLANHIDLRQEPYFSEQQRHEFARSLTMPRGVYVWMAQRNAGYVTATYRSTRRVMQPNIPFPPHLLKPPISRYRFEIYDCTFAVGFLMLQIIAARFTESETSLRMGFPTVTQPEVHQDFAVPIWPNPGVSVQWPPKKSIRNESLTGFVERFDRFNLEPWMR